MTKEAARGLIQSSGRLSTAALPPSGTHRPTYPVGGIGGFPSATVGTFTFLPGGKSIQDGSGGVHEFEVTEAGDVTYVAEKEPFFDGLNTSQLTLVGYDVIIDATALVAAVFSLGGIGSFSTTVVHTVTTLPGTKGFSSTDIAFDYEVRENGLLDYEASLDGNLSGRDTNILTVTP